MKGLYPVKFSSGWRHGGSENGRSSLEEAVIIVLLKEGMASLFGLGSSWRRGVVESSKLVVQPVSDAIWVEGM